LNEAGDELQAHWREVAIKLRGDADVFKMSWREIAISWREVIANQVTSGR
jgi:hypothetical protein